MKPTPPVIQPRKGINLRHPQLMTTGNEVTDSSALPLLMETAVSGIPLLPWSRDNLAMLKRRLTHNGAILLRGFQLESLQTLKQLMVLLEQNVMTYQYGSTPRTLISDGIYTATEYPAHQRIPLHNEMSYARIWPRTLAFFCQQPASSGGQTPLCDSRRVFAALDTTIRKKFTHHGVLYVRHYPKSQQQGLGLSWQETFQTQSQDGVEAQCNALQLQWQWHGETLTTRQVCQASLRHPTTGEHVWFNQAHLFHISSLTPALRKTLLHSQRESDLSRNSYYGDGSTIEDAELQHIRDIYQQHTLNFYWQRGDILLLDNILTAHGRTPFSGKRQVYVCMA